MIGSVVVLRMQRIVSVIVMMGCHMHIVIRTRHCFGGRVRDELPEIDRRWLMRNGLRKMVHQFTLPVVQAYMRHVQDNAAESVRRVIDRLHDCHFDYEMDEGTWIRVRITVDRKKREATVDFTGTSPAGVSGQVRQLPRQFTGPDGGPNPRHEVEDEGEVVERRQPVRQQLVGAQEMGQVGTRERPAEQARTVVLDGRRIVEEPAVAQVQAAARHPELAVPGHARRQDRIEQVHSPMDRLEQVGW